MKLHNQLIPKGRTIYFNEEKHRYTNELGIPYISATTIIGKYTEDFKKEEIAKACERIGRNPRHPKYEMYKNKSYKKILEEWEAITVEACNFGSKTHNYLELAVKSNNNYKRVQNQFINDRIYTIDDIIKKHNFGTLNLTTFAKYGIDKKYPQIYATLRHLTESGFRIYAEIGVYDDRYYVSGLIDILCVNWDTLEFIILDWKTNKAPFTYKSGYYAKHTEGLFKGLLNLDNFIEKNEFFKAPLNHIPDSVGHHYALQLSMYAFLCESFGLKFRNLCLFHIRPIEQPGTDRSLWEEVLEIHPIEYMKDDIKLLLNDYSSKNTHQTELLLL